MLGVCGLSKTSQSFLPGDFSELTCLGCPCQGHVQHKPGYFFALQSDRQDAREYERSWSLHVTKVRPWSDDLKDFAGRDGTALGILRSRGKQFSGHGRGLDLVLG